MNIRNINIPKFTITKIPAISAPSFKSVNLERTPDDDKFELSIGYVNDLHGQTNNMMRILSGIKGDLILSGGDNDIGDEKNRLVHDATAKFLNLAGVRGTALGNHEMDTMQGDLKETASKFNGDFFAINLEQDDLDEQRPNDIEQFNKADLNDFIKKSSVIEIKGERIGLIGTTPIDLLNRTTHPDYHQDCSVQDLDDSLELIQNEINEFKKQGINKVILLSHMGLELDKKIAENIDGIDVIVGGHTHELLEGIKEGENLFYSKTGEPVIITEAGKDGKYFGELNLTFDKNGVITKAQNNLGKTNIYHRNLVNQYIFNQILGEPEDIGYITDVAPIPKSLIEENPHANFMCDAMKDEMDADIGLWNNSGTRNYFKKGKIDSSEIKEIAPFADNISVADVSEKKLVDTFKTVIKDTYNTPGNKPGLLAVSGLNYTVSPSKKELVAMNFVDKYGIEHPIDINNPREDKKYKVVADSFMMSWGVEFGVLSPKEECTEYPFNKAFLACEYIKHLNKPIYINQTNRVRFTD